MKLLIIMGLLFSTANFAGERFAATAVYVDFTSFGSGINQTALENVAQALNSARSRGEIFQETQVLLGHEGEIRHCAHFYNSTQRYEYIQAISNSINSDSIQRTKVYVGADCNSFENATEQDLTNYLK